MLIHHIKGQIVRKKKSAKFYSFFLDTSTPQEGRVFQINKNFKLIKGTCIYWHIAEIDRKLIFGKVLDNIIAYLENKYDNVIKKMPPKDQILFNKVTFNFAFVISKSTIR